MRTLRDIQERKGQSDDARLLRFLLAAAPDLPPVWRGAPVSAEAVLAAARAAAEGDDAEQSTGSTRCYATTCSPATRARDTRRCATSTAAGARRRRSSSSCGKPRGAPRSNGGTQPRDVGGGRPGHAVSYDDVVYASAGKLVPPRSACSTVRCCSRATMPPYVDALRGEVASGLATVTGFCPWFDALWEKAQRIPVGVVVARHLLAHAQDDAQEEARRQRGHDGGPVAAILASPR